MLLLRYLSNSNFTGHFAHTTKVSQNKPRLLSVAIRQRSDSFGRTQNDENFGRCQKLRARQKRLQFGTRQAFAIFQSLHTVELSV